MIYLIEFSSWNTFKIIKQTFQDNTILHKCVKLRYILRPIKKLIKRVVDIRLKHAVKSIRDSSDQEAHLGETSDFFHYIEMCALRNIFSIQFKENVTHS